MYCVGFLLDFAIMVGVIAMPFYVYDVLGGGETMSGLIGGIQMGVYSLTCMIMSRFVARARNGLWFALFGVALFAVTNGPAPWMPNPYLFGAALAVAFMGISMVWPALHSWIGAEPDPAKRTRYVGWFNVSWSFGFAVSPLAAGPLYDLDFRLPFMVLIVLSIVCFLLIRSLPHERDYFGVATTETRAEHAEHDQASESFLYAAWAATFVANVLVGVTRTVYPKRVKDLLESGSLNLIGGWALPDFLATAPATTFAWIASVLSIMTALAFLTLGGSTWWRHRFHGLFIAQAASAAAFWALGRTTSLLVMAACFAVVGATLGLAFFSSVYYSLADPARKHARTTINEGVVGLGGFAGSAVFGYLIGSYQDTALPFRYTPLFILAAMLLQWLLLRYGHRRVRAAANEALATRSTPPI